MTDYYESYLQLKHAREREKEEKRGKSEINIISV